MIILPGGTSRLMIITLIVILFILLVNSVSLKAEGIICNTEKGNSVYAGASKGEVLQKCGRPLYISPDRFYIANGGATEETWTYVIDGCYCELVFLGNSLQTIVRGRLVR